MEVFKALKALINTNFQIKHKASGFNLTIQTMSPEGYAAVENVGKYDPLSDDKPLELGIEVEKDILYLAYGIKEFELDVDFAKSFYEKEGFGEDNAMLIELIRELNPEIQKRHEQVVLTLAFNPTEYRILSVARNNGLVKDVLLEISGEQDIIQALSRTSEILEVMAFFDSTAQSYNITPEHVALAEAKVILIKNGVDEDHLHHLPEYPKEPKIGPQGVYVHQS